MTVKHINAETVIRIDGVGPVGNELTPDNEAHVWSYGGKAYFSLPAGNTSIALPTGFYIVRTDNMTIKIEISN